MLFRLIGSHDSLAGTLSRPPGLEPRLRNHQIEILLHNNRPFHGFGCHLGWGANAAKCTVNVWEKSGVWCSIIRERLTFFNFYELQT